MKQTGLSWIDGWVDKADVLPAKIRMRECVAIKLALMMSEFETPIFFTCIKSRLTQLFLSSSLLFAFHYI
jgi:hypothetical protein